MTNLQFNLIIATIWLVGLLVSDKDRAWLRFGTCIFLLAYLFNFIRILLTP